MQKIKIFPFDAAGYVEGVQFFNRKHMKRGTNIPFLSKMVYNWVRELDLGTEAYPCFSPPISISDIPKRQAQLTNGRLVCITSLSSRGLATVIVSSGPARRDLKHQTLCFQITLGPRQTKEIIRKRGKLRPKLKNSLKELMPFDNRLNIRSIHV